MVGKTAGERCYSEERRIIREAKSNGRLVLFVGAGASVDSGMPLWNQVIDQIASRLSLTDKDKPYDYLKIPQYYYNSRGKKEYTQLMRELLLYGVPLKTTPLHKKLIEFQADTIITTNYDHLIEQAAAENAEIRYVISKDADLPYKNSSREIVKMHGDFENNNFVLKEQDYLQYSSNFKLVETYLKSLIGSKVVLFVGYSLNDPDVKQIFAWVNEVLKEDFQRAYLILTNVPKNEIERDYFRRFGVNIIYTTEFVDKWNDKTPTEQLVEFLDYILEDEVEKVIDRIYNELKPLNDLNYVCGKYIRNAMRKLNISCDDNVLDLSSGYVNSKIVNSDESDGFKELLWACLCNQKELDGGMTICDSDWNKLKVIKSVIKKSCFIIARRAKNEIELREDLDNSIEKLVYYFDYKKIYELKNDIAARISIDSPKLYMQQAFLCSQLNEYYYAYNCLKNAASIFYRNKEYTWYFLAEFNRKYVGKVCIDSYWDFSLSEKEKTQLEVEVKAIDISRILETIPKVSNNNYEFLSELGDFRIAYTLFYDMFSDSIKANEQAKTAYSFFAGVAAYERLRRSAQDYNDYETSNFILLEMYDEVRSIFLLYLRSVLASVMAEDIPDLSACEDTFGIGNVKQECLSAFDFYIMLRYLNQSDLKKLFKEYDVNVLPAADETIEYIEKIAESVFVAKEYVKQFRFSQNIFWAYLEIISHLDVPGNLAIKVLSYLTSQWNRMDILSNRDCINHFIVSLCKEKFYENSDIAKAAKDLIGSIFDFIISENCNYNYFSSIITNLSYICSRSGQAYNDMEKIRRLVDLDAKTLCTSVFVNLGCEAQEPIKKLFDSWKPESNTVDYCLYCDAVLSKIVLPSPDIEKKIYVWISSCYQEKKESHSSGIVVFPLDYSNVFKGLVNLFLNDLISDVKGLKETANLIGDPMTLWLLNMDEFDYSHFDCNWLILCRPVLLKDIVQNETAKKNILKAYKKQYETKAVISKINEIIIKYFISGPNVVDD